MLVPNRTQSPPPVARHSSHGPVRRYIQRPWISAVLLALLAADAYRISGPAWSNPSAAGLWLHERRYGRWAGSAASALTGYTHLYVVADRNAAPGERTLRLIDTERDSAGDLTAAVHGGAHDVGAVEYSVSSSRRGFWAITEQRFSLHVDVYILSGSLSGDELGRARAMAVEHLRRASPPALAEFLASGAGADGAVTRPVRSGHLHNGAVLAVAALFVVSLGWVPRAPAWIRAQRARRRAGRSLCASCAYPLKGLREGRCPECGCEVLGPESPERGA